MESKSIIPHAPYLALDDSFEDILDTLKENKELQNYFEKIPVTVTETFSVLITLMRSVGLCDPTLLRASQ